MNINDDQWITEIHKGGGSGLSFKVEKFLFSGQSEFQRVDVVRTKDHGVMLLNDGLIMLCERDEFIYHEMIAHVPLFVHPEPRSVLIIGGGDGGTAREVLRHSDVEKVVMVEIDEMVINACQKHLPFVSCSLDDPRLELLVEDGVKYVAGTQEKFDVILVDSTDPIGPATPLFNKTFYEDTAKILNKNGILVSQAESPFYDQDIQKPMLLNQRPFFKNLHIYLFSNLTYPGGLWSFGFASKGLCPIKNFNIKRFTDSGIKMRYYNANIHRSAFALPAFMSENLNDVVDMINF